MARPMDLFCCGCSLSAGVKFILLLNLIQNVFYITTATSNIIFRIPTFGFQMNLVTQTFNASFCLLGIPFIVAAFQGVMRRLETHVRLYFYYMVVSFVLDMAVLMAYFLTEEPCSTLPAALRAHGSAFACGFTRIVTIGSVLLLTVIQMYFMFAVWSFCEELKAGGAGSGLPELLASRGKVNLKRSSRASPGDSLFGTGIGGGPGFPVAYGSLAGPAMGAGSGIFDGTYHETSYPPSTKFV